MAGPKLQIDERIDRLETVVTALSQWLVDAQRQGFVNADSDDLEKILRVAKHEEDFDKEKNAREESEAEGLGVREQRSELGEETSLRQQG